GPDDAQVDDRLAHALVLKGEFQRAPEPASRAAELNPSDSVSRRLYSLLLEIQGNKAESYVQLKTAHRLDPQNDSILFQLGERERQKGKLQDSVESFRKASQLDPENPLYHVVLSQVHDKLGQKNLAALEQEKASEMKEAFEGYANAIDLAARGQRQAAAEVLEPFVQKLPEFVTGALFLAGLYSRIAREQQALDLYLTIVRRYPAKSAA